MKKNQNKIPSPFIQKLQRKTKSSSPVSKCSPRKLTLKPPLLLGLHPLPKLNSTTALVPTISETTGVRIQKLTLSPLNSPESKSMAGQPS
jgi:hypothetical protein